jgi:lipopolysaccharide transport system ATP-binding protein
MSFAIRADNLGKRYRLGATHARSIRELVNRTWHRLRGGKEQILPHEHAMMQAVAGGRMGQDGTFWALRDVSFEVQPGEVVGIIGRNGSGKSTLLKILSEITAPTTGRVELHGRVASLLEVGTGFHPELSGRENVFLNGAILGMTKSEIRRKFDEIVAFAEIDQFIDTPVKRYSSGMYVRLAFAVAAHLEPEILVLDEVLAVGDAVFQSKCLGKMGEVARAGRTVIFVSHNMQAVNTLCQRAMLLKDGRVVSAGPQTDVVRDYLESRLDQPAEVSWEGDAAPGNQLARLRSVRVLNDRSEAKFDHDIANSILLEMELAVLQPGSRIDASFHVLNKDGLCLFAVATALDSEAPTRLTAPGFFRAVCRIPANFLNDGRHYVSAFLVRNSADAFVSVHEVVSFQAHDYGTGRGGFMGTFIGAIRPHLPWDVERRGDVP